MLPGDMVECTNPHPFRLFRPAVHAEETKRSNHNDQRVKKIFFFFFFLKIERQQQNLCNSRVLHVVLCSGVADIRATNVCC